MKPAKSLRPRIRVVHGKNIAVGPGKAELLREIGRTGSITEAARHLGMSYMRAWLLIRTMNQCFKEPLVRSLRGGSTGGGAQLTTTGKTVVRLYGEMERKSLRAMAGCWQRLLRLLKD